MDDILLEQYRDKYEKELKRLRDYLQVLDRESGSLWRPNSEGTDYHYLVDKIRVTEEKIHELERLLQNPEQLLRRGKIEDLKRYKEKYEKKIADLRDLIWGLDDNLGDEIKYGTDPKEEAHYRSQIEYRTRELHELEEILSDPEKLLKKGKKDDLIEQEKNRMIYLQKKNQYYSLNPLQKLKYRLQHAELFSDGFFERSMMEENRKDK